MERVMERFIGSYSAVFNKTDKSVDVPYYFNHLFINGGYMTIGLDGCIAFYTNDLWQKLIKKLSRLPDTNKNVRRYKRLISKYTHEITLQESGKKIIIPEKLLDYANIENECLFVFTGNCFELWSNDNFDDNLDDLEEISESLTEFMI